MCSHNGTKTKQCILHAPLVKVSVTLSSSYQEPYQITSGKELLLGTLQDCTRAKIIAGGSSHDATPIYTLEVKALP